MYLKWIVCDVKKEKIRDFSIAQEKWNQTATAEGFVAQLGGWNINNSSEACILSIWEHQKYLDKFMRDLHDKIFENNKQLETYNSIQVDYFNTEFHLDKKEMIKVIKENYELFVSDYIIKPDRVENFRKIQKNYLISENQSQTIILNFKNDPLRFLTLSFSDKNGNEEIDLQNTIDKIVNKTILLVNTWKVLN